MRLVCLGMRLVWYGYGLGMRLVWYGYGLGMRLVPVWVWPLNEASMVWVWPRNEASMVWVWPGNQASTGGLLIKYTVDQTRSEALQLVPLIFHSLVTNRTWSHFFQK